MYIDTQEWLQVELLSGKPHEPLTADLIQRLLTPGDTFVDVGAHVGWLSLLGAKAVGASGSVIAIDPQPYNCDRILSNASANGFGNLTVVSGAVGEVAGPVRLSNQTPTDKARLTLAGVGINDTDLSFLSWTHTLPDLFETLAVGRVRVLKVDVEGFELSVFRGGQAVLDRVENVIFERLPDRSAGDFEAIARILQNRGFELVTVEGTDLDGQIVENNIWARRLGAR